MLGRNGRILRAPGFDDRAGRQFERIDAAIRITRDVLYARGYQAVETPLIEQTELFLRRSGGLLSSQLFDFVAPDGSDISLRPELTAPVVRHALEQQDAVLPMRFQYASPIFRYTERPYDAPASAVPNKRQFIQIGAELVGASHPQADGEIIGAAYELARCLGVEHVSIRIGHVGLIRELLGRFNLSERARLFLANNVSALALCEDEGKSVEEEAVRLGMMPLMGQQRIETQASAIDLLSRLASGSVMLPAESELTSRSAEDIVAGLRRKVEWDSANEDFPMVLDLMRQLSKVRSLAIAPENKPVEKYDRSRCGKSTVRHDDTISAARTLIGELDGLDDLASVVDAAESNGVDDLDLSVDFGFAASIAYYSGMIFEVNGWIEDEHVVLGGGGRYDGLASALGSDTDLPALGFALNLDTVLETTSDSDWASSDRRYIVVAPAYEGIVDDVVERAESLRSEGHNVVTVFDPGDDVERLAKSLGDAEVMRVELTDEDGEVSE